MARKLSTLSSSLARRYLNSPAAHQPTFGSSLFLSSAEVASINRTFSSAAEDGNLRRRLALALTSSDLSGSSGLDRSRVFPSVAGFSSSTAPQPSPPQKLPERHRENPPDEENPDPVTLQEQWRYATRMYSKWYAHAWGTAILAGLLFFALGWLVKGENPLTFGGPEQKKEGEE